MQGHIYRKTKPDGSLGRWHAVIDLPADRTGARRQKTTTHDTRREAQAWLAKTAQELRAGEVYDTKLTVGQFLLEWLEGKQSLRPSTRLEYRRHIRQLFIPELGHLRLLDLRSHHIEEVFARIADSNPTRERPITAQTMRRIHATLNSALNTALRRGLIRRNPAVTVDLPRPVPKKSRTWSQDEVATFLTSITDDPHHVLYRLLVLSGLRRGEVVGLQWGDLDLPHGTLTVNRQIVSVAGELHVGPPKSDSGKRTLALDTTTVQLLRLQHRRQRIYHVQELDEEFGRRFIFTRSDGLCLQPGYVSRHFITLARRSGLPPIRLHDLRHTSASLGLAEGESLLEVSRRLGHSSIGITADTYVHISSTTARESAQHLADLLDTATNPTRTARAAGELAPREDTR